MCQNYVKEQKYIKLLDLLVKNKDYLINLSESPNFTFGYSNLLSERIQIEFTIKSIKVCEVIIGDRFNRY